MSTISTFIPSPFGTLTVTTRKAIIHTLFAEDYDLDKPTAWEEFFAHYQREVGRMQISISRTKRVATFDLAAQSHDDILYVLKLLTRMKSRRKEEIRQELSGYFPSAHPRAISRSIDLVTRLSLMINVRDLDEPVQSPHKLPIQWEDEQLLQGFLDREFNASTTRLDSKASRLHPEFTVATMVNLCGLSLMWTDTLEDHLRLDRKRKHLWVFSYKRTLSQFLSAASKDTEGPALPKALLHETIITLNLLFPQWDTATQSLLSTHGQTFHTFPPFDGPRRLDLNEFSYWRSHLLELYEEIYLAPADSWRQLWADRRNPHQWWTFWIALMVLILSIISCMTSIIQAWASVKALGLDS